MPIRVRVRLEDPTEQVCARICAAHTAVAASSGVEIAVTYRCRQHAGRYPPDLTPGFEGELTLGSGVFLQLIATDKNTYATWLWTQAATAEEGLATISAAVRVAVEELAPGHIFRSAGVSEGTRVARVMHGPLFRCVPVPPMQSLHLTEQAAGQVARAVAHARFMQSNEGRAVYDRLGRVHKLVVLITGPPGSGKSSVALQVAASVSLDVHQVSTGPAMFGLHPGGVALVEGIDKLEQSPASALGLQQVLANNHTTAANREAGTASTNLLHVIDGVESPGGGAVLVMTSSHPELLGPALLGRVDHVIALDWATDVQVAALFASRFSDAGDTAPVFATALRSALDKTPVALGTVASFLAADITPEQAVSEAPRIADETRRRNRLVIEGSDAWWGHDRFPDGFLS